MLPTSALFWFILSVVAEVYSQSSNTPDLKLSTSNVCSDSQTVSDWILEAPSRLKINEKPPNKTVESAAGAHGGEVSRPRRRIVLMKFRGKRIRTRPGKTAPETEYRLDLVNKFSKNAEVLFVGHYPNRTTCGMGTFSSYEQSPLDKSENVKQKDECFWSIESSLSVKGKKQYKYITPKCGCFNFSYYIAYKPGDETAIERPDPASTDPFKKLTRTYCIAKGGLKGFKKHKKKKNRLRGGKKGKKHERREKIKKILARSRKDARSLPGKAPRLPYSEYSPYRRSEFSPYRENQMFFNEIEPSGSDVNNLNEHDESENSIKRYEYYNSGGFIKNSEDDDYGEAEEGQEEIDKNAIKDEVNYEGVDEPLVEAEMDLGLEGKNEQRRNEIDLMDVDERENNVNMTEEASSEIVEMDKSRSGEENGDSIEKDDDVEYVSPSESENRMDETESSEESSDEDDVNESSDENEANESNDENEEFKNLSGEKVNSNDNEIIEGQEINDNDSDEHENEDSIHEPKHDNDDSESDESDESAESEEKENARMFRLKEPLPRERKPTNENESDEESQESSEENEDSIKLSRVPNNERFLRREHRKKHFGLRMDKYRQRRQRIQRGRLQGNKKEFFKAMRFCCILGTFRKELILKYNPEKIAGFEICEDLSGELLFHVLRMHQVRKELCVARHKECCNDWSIGNKSRLDRFGALPNLH